MNLRYTTRWILYGRGTSLYEVSEDVTIETGLSLRTPYHGLKDGLIGKIWLSAVFLGLQDAPVADSGKETKEGVIIDRSGYGGLARLIDYRSVLRVKRRRGRSCRSICADYVVYRV